jgi:CheY-specific phosphatase CheX
MQQQILEPFVEETIASLTTMAGLDAEAGDAFEDNLSDFRFKGFAVATDVTGAVPGTVLLHLYPETVTDVGRRVFERMMGDEPAYLPADDLQLALNEWANVLVGRATRALEVAQLDVSFASPVFVHDMNEMETIMDGVVEIISIPIHIADAGRFYFNYLLHTKTVPS